MLQIPVIILDTDNLYHKSRVTHKEYFKAYGFWGFDVVDKVVNCNDGEGDEWKEATVTLSDVKSAAIVEVAEPNVVVVSLQDFFDEGKLKKNYIPGLVKAMNAGHKIVFIYEDSRIGEADPKLIDASHRMMINLIEKEMAHLGYERRLVVNSLPTPHLKMFFAEIWLKYCLRAKIHAPSATYYGVVEDQLLVSNVRFTNLQELVGMGTNPLPVEGTIRELLYNGAAASK